MISKLRACHLTDSKIYTLLRFFFGKFFPGKEENSQKCIFIKTFIKVDDMDHFYNYNYDYDYKI